MMVKFQDQCLLKLPIVSEYFVQVWPKCCIRCAPFQLTKLELSCAAGTKSRSCSSAISIMTSYQPGGVVVMGPHLLPGNFKCHFRKNSLFIVKNLNINHIDIYRHIYIYSLKGMIDIFNEKYDRYEEKQRCFLNSYFFLSHIMALDMRQKLQKLWVFLLLTGLELERD